MKKILVLLFCVVGIFATTSLQQIINQAKAGSKIELPQGIFMGNILIDKPLIIIGQGKKTIIQGETV